MPLLAALVADAYTSKMVVHEWMSWCFQPADEFAWAASSAVQRRWCRQGGRFRPDGSSRSFPHGVFPAKKWCDRLLRADRQPTEMWLKFYEKS